MKISMAVSTPDAEFSALALKGDYAEVFALLSDCGYDGAELAVRDPSLVDVDALESLLEKHGLVVPAIGTGRAFGEEGLSFSDPDEAVRRAAVERIKRQVDLGARLDALIIIGLIVGKSPRTERSEKFAVDCLKECAQYAASLDVRMVVEPINRYETGFIITVDDCLSFLDRVGEPACGVLFDTFHANIEEVSIDGSVRKAADRVRHVHVADSNRRHPGAGHLNFESIISTLREIGYDGFLSAEILPLPDPKTATRKNAEFLKSILS